MSELRREQVDNPGVEEMKAMVDRLLEGGVFDADSLESSGQFAALSSAEQMRVRLYAERQQKGSTDETPAAAESAKTATAKPAEKAAEKKLTKQQRRQQKKLAQAAEDTSFEEEAELAAPVVEMPVVSTPEPTTQKTPERLVTPEAKESWPKRNFLGYTAEVIEEPRRDGKGMIKLVRFTGHAEATYEDGEIDRNDYQANFGFSNETYGRLKSEPQLLELATVELTNLRRHIDEKKVSLKIDRPKDRDGEFVPKWVYYIDGQRHDEPFTLHPDRNDAQRRLPEFEDMPDEVIREIQDNPKDYYKSEAYSHWFNRAMARKREQAMGRAWEARHAPVAVAPSVEASKSVAVTSAEAVKEVETPVQAVVEQVAPVADKPKAAVVPRVEKPSSRKELWELFGDTEHEATQEDMRHGVHELVNRFSGMISDKVDADRMTEIITDYAMEGLRAQAQKAGGEFPERRRSFVREAVSEELNRLMMVAVPKKPNSDWGSEAVTRRERPAGDVILTEDEAEFMGSHPELAVSGVAVRDAYDGENKRVVITRRLERGAESEGLRELVAAAVLDALSLEDQPVDDQEVVAERLTAYLMNYLNGPHRDTPQGKRFRSTLLDVEGGKAVIRDYSYLTRVVRRLSLEYAE